MPVASAQMMPTRGSDSPPIGSATDQGSGKGIIAGGLKWLACLLLLATPIVFGAYLFLFGIQNERFSTSNEPVEMVIANTLLSVPANMIRSKKQRHSQTVSKLDLFVSWPDMNGYSEQSKAIFENPADVSDLVFVAIEPRAMMYDMSGRLRTIYARFFEGVGIIGPSGLVQQPLNSSAGFIDEDLFFDPSSPYPFVARCTRSNKPSLRPTCIRDVHLGKDLMMTYRFDMKLLPHWSDLDDKVRALGNRLKQL